MLQSQEAREINLSLLIWHTGKMLRYLDLLSHAWAHFQKAHPLQTLSSKGCVDSHREELHITEEWGAVAVLPIRDRETLYPREATSL